MGPTHQSEFYTGEEYAIEIFSDRNNSVECRRSMIEIPCFCCVPPKLGRDDMENGSSDKPGSNLVLHPSLTFFFHIGFVPFKTGMSPTGEFYWETFAVQKVLCILTSVSSFSIAVHGVYGCVTYLEANSQEIVAVFETVSNTASLASCVVILNILWRRRPQLMQVLECTQVHRVKHSKIIQTGVYLLHTLQVLLLLPVTFKLFTEASHYAFTDFWGNQNTTTTTNTTEDAYIPGITSNDKWRNAYFVGKLVFFMYVSNFHTLAQVLFMDLTVTVFVMGQEFKRDMAEIMSESDIEPGLALYHRLRKASNEIRDLFGDFLLSTYLSYVAYYAEAPHVLQGLRGSGEKIIFYYVLFMSSFWIMAAEFHYQVRDTLQKWLEFHSSSAELSVTGRLRLLAVSGDLVSDPIALSSKYFPVTYTHLSSMLGLIVTYAIIVLQMNNRGSTEVKN